MDKDRRNLLKMLPLAPLTAIAISETVEGKTLKGAAHEFDKDKKYLIVIKSDNAIVETVQIDRLATLFKERGINATIIANCETEIYEIG